MGTTRRKFIATAGFIGGSAAILPFSACSRSNKEQTSYPDYSTFDEIIKQPVLKRELFPTPVIIETLELLKDRNNFICRVRSKDGAEGISLGHPFISKEGYPMFMNLLQPMFLDKDARDLDRLIFLASERFVKRQGIPLVSGMVFTIEPMINLGKHNLHVLSDNWTAVTDDGSLSAQFEQTVLVTDESFEILTPFD